MSFSVAMLKAMREEGLSLDACIRVLEAGEPKQSSAAIRQKRYRDNKRDVTRDVTPSPNDIDILTPEELPQEAKASLPQTKKTKFGYRLPEDWDPKPLAGKAAEMVACWQAGELERELAKFKNYWLAKSGAAAVSTNWQRNWVNWLINADERKPRHGRTHTVGRHQPSDGLSSTARAGLAVFGN